MNLLFLTSDLGDTDAAHQLALLAAALPPDRFRVAVGSLSAAGGAAAKALEAAGVAVLPLPVRGPLDLSGMRRLRRAVRQFAPAVLHAVGPGATRLSRLVSDLAPRVVSACPAPGGGVGGWLAAREARRANRVVASGWAEAERYRRLGVRGERLTRIAPAVGPPCPPPERTPFCAELGAPPDAQLIFAGGYHDPAAGPKDAVIAFDMLRYVSPALQLVLTGNVDRRAAEDLGRALAFDDFRVRFAAPPALGLAEQVWVLASRGGEPLALRAMAAGRPVVAFRTPELAEVIDDGVTGHLVPPGDRAALAAKAQALLAAPGAAAAMGAAGQARAAERFGVARMAEQHARVYQELAG